jgi:hypothetical protein
MTTIRIMEYSSGPLFQITVRTEHQRFDHILPNFLIRYSMLFQWWQKTKSRKQRGPFLEPAGHRLTITFSISALQHICTAFQRFWNDLVLGDTRFGERVQRERWLNLLSGEDRPDLPLNQATLGMRCRVQNWGSTTSQPDSKQEDVEVRTAALRPAALMPAKIPSQKAAPLSSAFCIKRHPEIVRRVHAGGNEPYNFTSGKDGSVNLFKLCLKFTSFEFNCDCVLGMDILG